MQYHLFPHNVFNYWHEIEPKRLREDDHIIVMRQAPGVSYEPNTGSLGSRRGSVRARLLHQNAIGVLYKVLGSSGV